MKRSACLVAVALYLSWSAQTFAQTNPTLGGFVTDATGARIPGADITVVNTQTGVVTTVLSNESGAYQFPNLQTGTYTVTAELPGFQNQTYNVTLGVAQQVRLNFALQVGALTTAVEVIVAADTLLATSSSSVGSVLPDAQIRDLPLASRNALDLVALSAGVQGDNLAGARINQLEMRRDGINIADGRYDLGVFSQVYTSPDMVEEVRVVVSAADAETSRAGAVQMSTRSGTNQYRGSLFWTNHNSALDANSWDNNRQGLETDYLNRNQFGGRIGGPIVRNKAFFFFLYDGQRTLSRSVVTTPVLTAPARQGIFRYFPGVNNANATASVTTGSNQQAPVVDLAGNPVRPAAATGDLVETSLFNRDPLRPGLDPTGYIQEILARSPLPNYFQTGDGLNTAGYQWVRRVNGSDNANGNGVDVNRNQYNLRLDYNINDAHKLFLTGTYERVPSEGNSPPFPDSPYKGEVLRTPQVYTGSFVSTLTPTLLNELRLGWKRARHLVRVPYSTAEFGPELMGFISRGPGGYPWLADPVNFSHFFEWGAQNRDQWSDEKTFSDTVSLTHGEHAFRIGAEARWSYNHSMQGANAIPTATMGAPSFAPVTGIDGSTFPGLLNTNQNLARSILADLSGSITQVVQNFELEEAGGQFLDFREQTREGKHREIHQNGFSAFFKDEWNVLPDLTLNLGIRWDWFGSPWDQYGLAGQPVGADAAIHGLTGTRFDGTLTRIDFLGKHSTNPDTQVWNDDYNNFAPSVGFSWSLPYFARPTVLRGGYGISYQGGGRTFSALDGALGSIQGLRSSSNSTDFGLLWREFGDIVLPLPRGEEPLFPIELNTRNSSITVFPKDYVNPYVQNFNLEVQHDLGGNMTLEVRYVGSKGTKLYSQFAVNQISLARDNPEFLDAVQITQAGGDAAFFDQMLMGLNVPGYGVVDGQTRTGSAALRTWTSTRTNLANNNIGALANFLDGTNALTGENGGILRNAGLPEDYFKANPQFNNVTLNGNAGSSTYHSMVVQWTKRMSNGLSAQTSYTWSKGLGVADGDSGTGSYRDIYNRQIEKSLLGFHRTHTVQTHGTYELPFGPNRQFLNDTPGWVSRLVERWQFGAIGNWTSGAPLNVTAATSSFSQSTSNTPMMVGDFSKSLGEVLPATDVPGARYFQGLVQVDDPYVANLTTANALNTRFNRLAIQDSAGNFLLVNPGPGDLGTMGQRWIEGPGTYSMDLNLVKRIQIDEAGKELELRLDAINFLNHSNWGDPNLDINSANFGRITSKDGNRTFTINARLNF